MRALVLILLTLAVAAGAAFAAPSTSHTIVLEGDLSRADHQTYRDIPFDVPPGIERLTVTFSYERENRTVVDLGIADPNGVRGWSGGNKASFTIASSDATPSYTPGPITPGQWRLMLGMPNVREGVRARYRAEIRLDPVATPTPPVSAFFDGPLRKEPGWRRGDFHTHTAHSDGSCDSLSGRRVPCPAFRTLEAGRRAGLDFVAVTDHNTASQNAELRELQAYYDTLLIIPGREITTFYGHMNVFGPTGPLAFRIGAKGEGLQELLDDVRAQHGLASINHPAMPSGEACMGCGWTLPLADGLVGNATVAAVEIANGGTMKLTGSAEGPLSAIPFWQSLLDRGLRITAIGGSDSHDPDAPVNRQYPVGRPTTVVYAQTLSQRGVLDGVRAGRVFVDLDGVADRVVDLTLTARGGQSPMGAVARVGRSERARLTVAVNGVPGGQVELVAGAAAPKFAPTAARVPTTAETLAFTLPAAGTTAWWVRANVRDASGRLVLISNPIYVKPK